MSLFDEPVFFDPINRTEGVISTFRNADWDHVYQKNGLAGLIGEFLACATSSNAPMICVARGSHWRGIDVERLLKRHGVKVWDRGITGEDLYFSVKRRQLRWAEYLLLRAGVPVTSVLEYPRNARYADRYAPGSEPPTHSARSNSLDEWTRRIIALFQ